MAIQLTTDDVAKYLTTDDVAEICRTSPSTVRYWRANNRGPRGFKVGRRVLYDLAAVKEWLEDQAGNLEAS